MIRDVVVAAAAISTAGAALSGVDAWKRQMTGERKYLASLRVLSAARKACDAVLHVRGLARKATVDFEVRYGGKSKEEAEATYRHDVRRGVIACVAAGDGLRRRMEGVRLVLGDDGIKDDLSPIFLEIALVAIAPLEQQPDEQGDAVGIAGREDGGGAYELTDAANAELRITLDNAMTLAQDRLRRYMH